MAESIEENMFLIIETLVEISRIYPSEEPSVGRPILREETGLTNKQLTDALTILEKKRLVEVDYSPSGHFKATLKPEGKLEFEHMQKEKALLKNQEKIEKKEDIMEATFPSIDKIWDEIQKDYDVNKRTFGKKIDFVKDELKRTIIFRDIAHAYILANNDLSKPAVILVGGVIEELLRLYLKQKEETSPEKTFDSYIKTCKEKGLLKSAISNLTDSARYFRNIVHLKNEKTPRDAISKATAKGTVSSIFSLANDFH